MSIKEAIKQLEELMNRLSILIHELTFGAEQQDVAKMWSKVKYKHERLFLLDQAIDIQRDNLKNGIVDQVTREIVSERLERDIVDVKNQLKTIPTLVKKAEDKLSSIKVTPKNPIESKPQIIEVIKEQKSVAATKKRRVIGKTKETVSVESFEKKQIKNIAITQNEIKKIYERSVFEISITASKTKLKDQPFSLNIYPHLKNKVESTIGRMHKDIYNQIIESVEGSWGISNKKNDFIVDKRLADKVPTTKAKQILYDPNLGAYNSFITRKEKGMNLSERIWNLLEPFKSEMEQGLGMAINKGQAATKTATTMKQFLHEPDKLFRRVRGEDGKLRLSKAARNYHPGQGIYRSSYKNALRLTATENNIAYRTADFERWNKLPFVIGVRVKLSNNHPKYDICDPLAGLYPKDFKFTGWHPWCKCFAVPEMLSDAEYDKIEDQILAGEPVKVPDKLIVSQPPKEFTKYLSDNKKRIAGWSNKPYWVKDNKKYI